MLRSSLIFVPARSVPVCCVLVLAGVGCGSESGDPGDGDSEGEGGIPFPYSSQHSVAWAPGEWNTGSCSWENEKLWTAGRFGQGGDEVTRT